MARSWNRLELISAATRLFLASWLVVLGIIYGIAALGYTHPPSKEWTYMAFAIVFVRVATIVARKGLI
jgi:hypothetical protein